MLAHMRRCLLLYLLICIYGLNLLANKSLLKEIEQQIQTTRDTALLIDLHFKAGKIHFNDADFVSALDWFFKGLRLAEKSNDVYRQGAGCNNISAAYKESEELEPAEKYAQKAIAIFTQLNDDFELGNAHNSLANVFYMQERDSLALAHYKISIEHRKAANDSLGLFATLKNLGAIHYQMGDTLNAIKYMEQSLKYLNAKSDSIRWFSAYMTLGELYVYAGFLEKGKQNLDKAAQYISSVKAYHKLKDYHHALYRYYYTKEKYELAFEEYVKYEAYKDSVENTEKSRQLFELNIQYETEKKEALISHQQQLLEKEKQAKRLYLLVFVVVVLLFVAMFLIYRIKQKQKTDLLMQQQNEKTIREIFNAEQKERIRIARDLHDSIGQKLAVMRMLLPKSNEHPELEKVASYLDETATEVRSISHNLIPEILNFGLIKAIEGLADRINSTENIKVNFRADDSLQKLSLSKQTELSLYRIVQEILSNIIRHSKTDSVLMEMKCVDDMVQLVVKDNGVGFETQQIDESKGLGWKNIFARIKLMNGDIKIESQKNRGSNFLIHIPIA